MVAAPTLEGKKLGSYEVQALLGSGGMASVFRAFDANLQRVVAIKVLSAAVVESGFVERFRQEARLLASLRHPHIVHVYDFGEQDGYTYMVQELLPGPTLEQRLSKLAAHDKRLDREEVVAIITQLASALDAAHASGIIHRDVKPSNVMWNAAGVLVLTDFGIAKSMSGNGNQTQAGLVIGTPHYLAPEQAQGLPLSPASDIYALGVVLYELLTGYPPFNADATLQVVMDHIQTPPPALGPLRPDLPAAVETVVQQALAKDPSARFAGAGDFARALAQAWPPQQQPAVVPDVHNQATRMWQAPHVASPQPVQPVASAAKRQASPASIAVPNWRNSRMTLPILGALLALLLLGGAALAARSESGAADASAPSAVTTATAAPVTNTPAATAAPVIQPTTAPAVPTLEPEPLPADVSSPAENTEAPGGGREKEREKGRGKDKGKDR